MLVKYFEYVKSLAFEQVPDYDFLRKNFKEVLINRKEETAPFSWECKKEGITKKKI